MKTLYIIRGLPGSGKSTLGKQLCGEHSYQADDFFYVKGEYRFDGSLLAHAHYHCEQNVSNAMQEGVDKIATCNVFAIQKDVDAYIKLAQEYRYSIQLIECQSNFGSVHNVPQKTIQQMATIWQKIELD